MFFPESKVIWVHQLLHLLIGQSRMLWDVFWSEEILINVVVPDSAFDAADFYTRK